MKNIYFKLLIICLVFLSNAKVNIVQNFNEFSTHDNVLDLNKAFKEDFNIFVTDYNSLFSEEVKMLFQQSEIKLLNLDKQNELEKKAFLVYLRENLEKETVENKLTSEDFSLEFKKQSLSEEKFCNFELEHNRISANEIVQLFFNPSLKNIMLKHIKKESDHLINYVDFIKECMENYLPFRYWLVHSLGIVYYSKRLKPIFSIIFSFMQPNLELVKVIKQMHNIIKINSLKSVLQLQPSFKVDEDYILSSNNPNIVFRGIFLLFVQKLINQNMLLKEFRQNECFKKVLENSQVSLYEVEEYSETEVSEESLEPSFDLIDSTIKKFTKIKIKEHKIIMTVENYYYLINLINNNDFIHLSNHLLSLFDSQTKVHYNNFIYSYYLEKVQQYLDILLSL